ncbi:MAG TPA: short-chain dehydrogenase/reductase [Solirubrobacteraceae bacterium]|nr:short-chain dehydrogenase/reductase [Solirubrobacteraceae bacterium]
MAETPYVLNGKVALVTGGARGIGFATAQLLARRGASVVVVDLDDDAARAAASQIGDAALGIGADVTDRAAMQRAVASTVERFGGLDVVMANAGLASRAATMRAMSPESFDRVFDVNTHGVVETVHAALPEIVRRRGHVVVVASVYAFINGIGAIPYAMSKAAVEQLGRALRVELVPHGASASVAYFGFIDTEMVHRAIDEDPLTSEMMKTLPPPLRKRLTPPQAAAAVVDGIERRRAQIIVPRRWIAMSALRGVLSPLLDAHQARHAATQSVVARLDERGDEEQPTTE